MSGRDKKEFKIVIQKEKDPELHKWALSLNYGLFPKLIIEMLRWYEKNGLLIKGGVASPDLLMSLNQNSKTIDSTAFEKQVIEKLSHLENLINSKSFEDISSNLLKDKSNDENVMQESGIQDITSDLTTHTNPSMGNEVSHKLVEEELVDEDESLNIPSPILSNFKVFKFRKKDDKE